MKPTSWIEVNLATLDHNVATIRGLLGRGEPTTTRPEPAADSGPPPIRVARTRGPLSRFSPPASASTAPAPIERSPLARRPLICAVIKADAYGLGAAPIATRLAARTPTTKSSAPNEPAVVPLPAADLLAVYSQEQAEQIAALNLACPILILMPFASLSRSDPLYRPAVTGRVHFSIHDRAQIAELDHLGRTFGSTLTAHLYVDTGMSRGGVSQDQAPAALADLASSRHIRLAGVYTHPASAEADPASLADQVARLDSLLIRNQASLPNDLIIHVANTAAAIRSPQYHRDMVRVGLGLYGYGAELFTAGQPIDLGRELRPITRWLSRIVHLQRVPRNAPVGYNATHKLRRDSMLGLVPAGYADGYPLSLSNKATVDVEDMARPGQTFAAPVLGRVNMDQIVIDLTDAPNVPMHSVVTLISDNPASACALPKLAKAANSSCYEMLCRLSPRVPRRYLTSPAVS